MRSFESEIKERKTKDTKFVRYMFAMMALIAFLFKEQNEIFTDIGFILLAMGIYNSRYYFDKITQKKKYYFQAIFGLLIILFYLIRIVQRIFGLSDFA